MMVIVPLLPTLQTLDTDRISSTQLGITPTGIIKGYERFWALCCLQLLSFCAAVVCNMI